MASIVVFTDRLEETISFYQALGVSLADEDHGDGLIHTGGELDGIRVAVFAASRSGRSPGLAAWRQHFHRFLGQLARGGATALEQIEARVLCEHQHRRCGCRIVFAGPGRPRRGDQPARPLPDFP